MFLKPDWHIKESEATSESVYWSRRKLMGAGLIGGAALAMGSSRSKAATGNGPGLKKLQTVASPFSTKEAPNSYEDITTYNNFYEFGIDKSDPSRNAGSLRTSPWTVAVDGLVSAPKRYDVNALIKGIPLEERVYRHRCVEAWSMVIPWVGIPLASVIKRLNPLGSAKYIGFDTLNDPKQMPGLLDPVVRWPYTEGLRMDEAMNPLTLLAVGLYGKTLPNQNGAPMRLVVPWKYGFKSIKSIVAIHFTETPPRTAWNDNAPHEYGFYANVNPKVDHPRWSQASERRIGDGFFAPRRPTVMFNGYGAQVAHLYNGMDLRKYF